MRPWPQSRFADFEVYVETLTGQRLVEYEEDDQPHAESSADARRRSCFLECPKNLEQSIRVVYKITAPHPVDFAMDIDIDGRDVGYSRGYNSGWTGEDRFDHVIHAGEGGTAVCSDMVFELSKEEGQGRQLGEIKVFIQEGIATRVPPFAIDLATQNGISRTSGVSELVIGSRQSHPVINEYCTGFFEQSDPVEGRFMFVFKYGTRRALVERGIIAPDPKETADEAVEKEAGVPEEPPESKEADAIGESDGEVVDEALILREATSDGLTPRQAEIARLQARLALLIKEEEEEHRLAHPAGAPVGETPEAPVKRSRAEGEEEEEPLETAEPAEAAEETVTPSRRKSKRRKKW